MINQGTVYEGFRLTRPLGGGWLGEVYAAQDLDAGHTCALRVLAPEHLAQPQLLAQFARLFDKMSRLRHPGILQLGEFVEGERRAYYTMNLAQGGSLRQLLQGAARDGQQLELLTVVDLVRQAAAALAAAHRADLMHGNLKPENLLLQPARPATGRAAFTLQLSDFGVGELRAYTYGTHDRLIVTTPAYMSPEQCRGVRGESRSDIYALGVILYELLTLLVPFETRDLADALEKHQHVAPIPPGRSRRDLPGDLEEVVLTCLAKAPEYRYASAEDLEAALQAVQNRLMPQGPSPTVVLPDLPVAQPAFERPQDPCAQPRLLVLDRDGKVVRAEPLGSADVTVGRSDKNTVVLDHPGVSRHHLNLQLEGEQVMVTDLSSTNGSVLDHVRLPSMKRVPWAYESLLRVDPYWLALVAPRRLPVRSRIGVSVEAEELTLVPGVPQTLRVQLANTGQTVDHFMLSVQGVPAAWVQGALQEVQLNPSTRGEATLRLLVPRDSASRAGTYPVSIQARSRENPQELGEAPMTWQVSAYSDTRVEVTPERRSAWFRTRYQLLIHNGGNVPTTYQTAVRDDEGAVRLPSPLGMMRLPRGDVATAVPVRAMVFHWVHQLREGVGQVKVAPLTPNLLLAPGATHAEPIRVKLPVRWVGSAKARSLQVAVSSDHDRSPPVTVRLQQNPVIPLWWIPLLALLAALAFFLLNQPPTFLDVSVKPERPRVGERFTVSWETRHARRVKLQPFEREVAGDSGRGEYVVEGGVSGPTDLKLTAYGRFRSAQHTLTVSPQLPPPAVVQFEVTPLAVAAGKSVTVRWNVANVRSVNLEPFGTVDASGEATRQVSADTSFRLSASAGGETITRNVDVKVLAPVIESFKVIPANAEPGETVTLRWKVLNATSVELDPIGTVDASGEIRTTAQKDVTYRITAGNGQARVTSTGTVTVVARAPSVLSFSVSPERVRPGENYTLRWQTQDATSVELLGPNGAQSLPTSGEVTQLAPPNAAPITFTLSARNAQGQQKSATAGLQVVAPPPPAPAPPQPAPARPAPARPAPVAEQPRPTPPPPPQILKFQASRPRVTQGETVTLSWDVKGAGKVTLSPPGKTVPARGSLSVPVSQDTTFTLVAADGVRAEQRVSVQAPPPKILGFKVSADQVAPGESVTLQWEASGVPEVTLSPPGKTVPARGSLSVPVSQDTTFILVAADGVRAEREVKVRRPVAPQILGFKASATQVERGGQVTLKWQAKGVTQVTLRPLGRTLEAQGSLSVPVDRDTTFTLVAGPGVQAEQRVRVKPAPAPVPAEKPGAPALPLAVARPAEIVAFEASADSIEQGESVTFTWNVRNARRVTLSPLGPVETSGSADLSPPQTSTYTLRAEGEDGKSVSRNLRVSVKRAPVKQTLPGSEALEGTWQHTFGKLTLQVDGTNVTGTFTNDRTREQGQVRGKLEKSAAGGFTLNARVTFPSQPDEKISFVAAFNDDLNVYHGPYSTRSARERWCGWKPGVAPPAQCN